MRASSIILISLLAATAVICMAEHGELQLSYTIDKKTRGEWKSDPSFKFPDNFPVPIEPTKNCPVFSASPSAGWENYAMYEYLGNTYGVPPRGEADAIWTKWPAHVMHCLIRYCIRGNADDLVCHYLSASSTAHYLHHPNDDERDDSARQKNQSESEL
jgi:hypothetical protein